MPINIPMTHEEEQILALLSLINDEGTRDGLIKLVEESKPANNQITGKEPATAITLDTYNGALHKLRAMSDEEFSNLELKVDYAALGFPDSIADLM